MTDDELNAAVAKAEGWQHLMVAFRDPRWVPPGQPGEFNMMACSREPPPYATDWQWCGPLVEKHGISVAIIRGPSWVATATDTFHGAPHEPTPQRAICLAVLAAAGEPTARASAAGPSDPA